MDKKRAVLLDRDGVINPLWYDPDHGTIDSPYTLEQFRLIEGVPQAIKQLRAKGFVIAIVSNQPGIGKGKVSPQLLDLITNKMHDLLDEADTFVDGVYYCLHHPEAIHEEYRRSCSCRKPEPGLLLQAAEDLNLDLNESYTIGDGITDLQAGKTAGCSTVWIGRWKCDVCQLTQGMKVVPDIIASSLLEAAQKIIDIEEEKNEHISGYIKVKRY